MHSNDALANPFLVSGRGGCSCMLQLPPSLTCTDASPYRCTLCLCCYLYIISRKHSTSTCGGCHQLQLVLVVFSFGHWCTYFTCTRATCTVWCWSVHIVLVAVCVSDSSSCSYGMVVFHWMVVAKMRPCKATKTTYMHGLSC